MIDYLELYRQEENDALWEAVRRLSDPLLGAEAGQEGETLESPSGDSKMEFLSDQMARHTRLGENMNWLVRKSEHRMGRTQAETGGTRGSWGGEWSLERAAEAGDMRKPPGRTSEAFWEMGQAEQLDRIFRRDSRRYDGGFFLY